ncbi:MAG: hypothetical protein GC185_06430 [Alphaproteobacteria bacterium]|nr:hypothetical protein [Alphaproteobacteria bacterium]
MKRMFLFLCLAGFLLLGATASRAADFGISPFPAHGDKPTPVDIIDALQDVHKAGATATVITKTWRDLEPAKGLYNLSSLARTINDSADMDMKEMVGIQVINTTKRDMPPDLMDKKWDDPEVAARFDALMHNIALMLTSGPKFVSIGNEADVYFQSHPDELPAYMKFFQHAQSSAQRTFQGARVGITVTYEGLVSGREKIIQTLLQPCPVAIFTYYPLVNMKPLPLENVGEHLDAIVKAAGERPVVLQEVGFPSGVLIGSSQDKQAFFFKTVIPAIRQRPQIAMANLFMLHDFTDKLCNQLVRYYNGDKWPAETKDKFRDFMCTLGMKDENDKPKSAWHAVLEAMQEKPAPSPPAP